MASDCRLACCEGNHAYNGVWATTRSGDSDRESPDASDSLSEPDGRSNFRPFLLNCQKWGFDVMLFYNEERGVIRNNRGLLKNIHIQGGKVSSESTLIIVLTITLP